jgi:hypothetical protein
MTGAPLVAWHAALPRFRGVIGIGVPFQPRGPVRLYFQTPGVAEAEYERDVRLTLGTILLLGLGECSAARG